MIRCKLLTVYYTVRYGLRYLFSEGEIHIIAGHDFDYTDEVHNDSEWGAHWVMSCSRCGIKAGTDVAPNRQ